MEGRYGVYRHDTAAAPRHQGGRESLDKGVSVRLRCAASTTWAGAAPGLWDAGFPSCHTLTGTH